MPSPSASKQPWPSRYVGRPFDDHDGAQGAHCWGLVRRVFEAERGILLPAYGAISASDMVAMAREVRDAIAHGPWMMVPAGQETEFDVALFNGWVTYPDGDERYEPNHVGIFALARNVLHVERATAAVHIPLTHKSLARRYAGAWRYRMA
jgi:cell wall-associated NlpC family hydrolase